jgi:hypothetical protein
MQDRYAFDIGDFGKFGLLRALCGHGETQCLSLSILWWLYPNENHNDDGKHIAYLRHPSPLRSCDPDLYDRFRAAVISSSGEIIQGNRRIAVLECTGALPPSTAYYSIPLSFPPQLASKQRLLHRDAWLSGALDVSAACDLVFLDPDNGIECKSIAITSRKGPKYVYWADIDRFLARGQSVVVYHHLNRTASSDAQVRMQLSAFRGRLPPGYGVTAVTYKRGTRRAYFIVQAPEHRELLRMRLADFLSGEWGLHFELAEDDKAPDNVQAPLLEIEKDRFSR